MSNKPSIKRSWLKKAGNKYLLILLAFVVWMLFFDTNSFLVHQELDEELEKLENNRKYYEKEISKDKEFLQKLQNEEELEKFARETYFLKKEDEDIFIIEHQDSINQDP